MIIIVFLFSLPSKPSCKGCNTCVKALEQRPREKAIGIAATEANSQLFLHEMMDVGELVGRL